MKPEIIIAMDVAHQSALRTILPMLPAELSWFKVGLELYCAEGPSVLEPLQNKGKNIFLDLKLHDIPRTVEKSISSISKHHVQLLTVHASGGEAMLKAAAEAAKSSSTGHRLKLLAVTVLTSLDQSDLSALGLCRTPAEQALALAELAYSCGIDGVVCSLHEATAIRKALGPDALIVTPGIRLPGNNIGDQKRVGTPRDAMDAGATHLVIGRPILQAADPHAAYRAIMQDLEPLQQ